MSTTAIQLSNESANIIASEIDATQKRLENKWQNEDFELKQTRLEKLEKQFPNVVFHKGFHKADTLLKRKGYNALDTFEVGESLFFAYMKPDCFLYIQMDKKGRTLNFFREVDFVSLNDVIETLDIINDKNKTLHTVNK